jgi:hypothetical protein
MNNKYQLNGLGGQNEAKTYSISFFFNWNLQMYYLPEDFVRKNVLMFL